MTTGILYVAIGARHLAYTACSIASLRAVGYEGEVLVLADDVMRTGWPDNYSGFDSRVKFSFPVNFEADKSDKWRSRFLKTQLPNYTPFDNTLFVDADTIFLQNPELIWDELGEAQFGIVRDDYDVASCKHATQGEKEYTIRYMLGENLPQWNSGVMAFRKSDLSLCAFQSWHESWLDFQDIDQLALVRGFGESVGADPDVVELPRKYNCYAHTLLDAYKQGAVIWHPHGLAAKAFTEAMPEEWSRVTGILRLEE